MSYTAVPHLVAEHQDWLKALDFYDNELDILENRLTEVAQKNTGLDAMKGVEHFQNQFIIQRNSIDELRHNMNEHAHKAMLDIKGIQAVLNRNRWRSIKRLKTNLKSLKK